MSRLVLVGGGHAHLFVLEALAHGTFPAIEASLVSLDPWQAYSGMVPGLIGGRYGLPELRFDLAAMCRRAGVSLIEREVVRLEPSHRRILLAGGASLEYDLLSVAIGSTVEGGDLPGVAEHALRVKPIGRAVELVPALERAARLRDDPSVVVVGGGAAGVEVALAARARLRALGRQRSGVTLVEAGAHLLGGQPPAAERVVGRALTANAVTVRLCRRVSSVASEAVRLESGEELRADMVVWATGAAAPALLRDSGLPVDSRGFLLVTDRLHSTANPTVFAAGDTASLAPYPATPKAGVYAVREGPVLARNLAAAIGGGTAIAYRPQPRFLALLNTGDGRAVLSYGRVAVWASWAMRLKDWIDRGFMRRFQRLEGHPGPP